MQRRQSIVYLRKRPLRRRTLRLAITFILSAVLLLALGVGLLIALILSGLATIIAHIFFC
jgi:hypothetical protein